MLDYKNIEIIKTIKNVKNISQASKELFTAQPNLSRSLKKIENNLGFKIFNRSNVPLNLTPEGEILFEYIEKMEILEREMFNSINSLRIEGKNNFIRIGSLSFLSQYIIPNIVPKLINSYPNLELSLTKYDSSSFERALLNNEIDLFITNRSINNKKLKSTYVTSDKIYLIFPKSISKSKKDLKDFSNETFYLLNPIKNLRKSVEDIFCDYNFYPTNIKMTSSIMNCVSFVLAKKGVTFVYESSLSMINPISNCEFFAIEGDYADITIVYRDPFLEDKVNTLSKIIINYLNNKNKFLSKI